MRLGEFSAVLPAPGDPEIETWITALPSGRQVTNRLLA
jgi:hypothetical protein